MKLPIITVPDPKLRHVSKPVNLNYPQNRQFVADLGETLVKKSNPPGVGLSAIQVGTPLRVFYTLLPQDYDGTDAPHSFRNLVATAFINPKITGVSPSLTLGPNPKKPLLEGCLSIPHIYGPVARHEWIDLEYSTLDSSTPTQKRFSGFHARVIEHEYDHLDGILFTDHILKQKLALYFDTGDDLQLVANPSKILTW